MKVKLNKSVQTRSVETDAEVWLAKGQEFDVVGTFNQNGDNTITDENGTYVVNGQHLDYVGEDEPDGI